MPESRRAAFRRLVRRLDPASRPEDALEQGLYVEPPGSISERLTARLELEPTGSHMLVGSIGSGKTTQLLCVQQRLAEVDDVRAFYVDVLSWQQREHLGDGVLLALLGAAILDAISELKLDRNPEFPPDHGRVRDVVKGYSIHRGDIEPPDFDDYPEFVWRPGILKPPERNKKLRQLAESIRTLVDALPFTPVLLFDGLDRLTDMETFVALVTDDVRRIQQAGAGAVVIAPQIARGWQHGAMAQCFDELHMHGASSVTAKQGRAFLRRVLTTRTDDSALLSANLCVQIARHSGGIVRDLLALARAACEEAYRTGAERVESQHVDNAAEHFGRNLLVGISEAMSARIRELAPRRGRQPMKSFIVATEVDQMLLLHRLVIEIPTSPVSFILHPTVKPLLRR